MWEIHRFGVRVDILKPLRCFVKQICIDSLRFGVFAEKHNYVLYNLNNSFVGADQMNRIKELRMSNGWRQQDLAARLNTNQQTVGRYETGTRGLDVETILKLCEIFGCSADYLLGRSALPSPDLSEEELELVLAFRRADDRSREMVRLALAPFIGAVITAESAK